MDIGNDIGIVEVIAVVGIVYLLYQAVQRFSSGIGTGLGGVTDTAANAATGKLTQAQIAQAAQNSAAGVAKAGGSATAQQSAATETTNFANWSMPLGGVLGIGAISADTEIPGTGQTVYQLRAAGLSDDDIQNLIQSGEGLPINDFSL